MQLATVAERSEAIASLQRAVAISRQVLGPQHPQTKAAERSLAAISAPHADRHHRLPGRVHPDPMIHEPQLVPVPRRRHMTPRAGLSRDRLLCRTLA